MWLWLLENGWLSGASWGKITPRAAVAAVVSFALAVLLGRRLIAWLGRYFREPNQSDSPTLAALHQTKHSTPTMGGVFMLAAIAVATLLLADPGNAHVLVGGLLLAGLGAIGVIDDLLKMRGRKGLMPRPKFLAQLAVTVPVAVLLYWLRCQSPEGLSWYVPLAGWHIDLGIAFIPATVVVLAGSANAVNLTDGLDGLAGGCLLLAVGAMTAVAYLAGHAELAEYLGLPHLPGLGELVVPAAAALGAILGFLWFNCHPAQVFMGDAGSLPLGGLLGYLAVATGQPLLLAIIGGVFVAEAVSVILQVGYFKLRKRRIFRCAPLHHHFQFAGWPESKVVVRFWIAGALCAALALGTMKLSAGTPGVADSTRRPNRPQCSVSSSEAAIVRAFATDDEVRR